MTTTSRRLLLPTVRLAYVNPALHVQHKFPLWVAYFRQVLPHVNAAWAVQTCTWLSHAQSTMPDTTPRLHAVSVNTCLDHRLHPGASGASRVLNVSLPACHGLMTPADLHILAITDASVLPSASVKTLGVHDYPFRSCTSTSGYTVIPAAYRILCLRLDCLVRRSNLSTPPQTQDSIRVAG